MYDLQGWKIYLCRKKIIIIKRTIWTVTTISPNKRNWSIAFSSVKNIIMLCIMCYVVLWRLLCIRNWSYYLLGMEVPSCIRNIVIVYYIKNCVLGIGVSWPVSRRLLCIVLYCVLCLVWRLLRIILYNVDYCVDFFGANNKDYYLGGNRLTIQW